MRLDVLKNLRLLFQMGKARAFSDQFGSYPALMK